MEITKEEFEKIYNENTLTKAGKILGVTGETVRQYAKKLGIKPKGKGNRAKLIIKKSGIKNE